MCIQTRVSSETEKLFHKISLSSVSRKNAKYSRNKKFENFAKKCENFAKNTKSVKNDKFLRKFSKKDKILKMPYAYFAKYFYEIRKKIFAFFGKRFVRCPLETLIQPIEQVSIQGYPQRIRL